MAETYWDARIAQLKVEHNSLLAQIMPFLSRMDYIQGQIDLCSEFKAKEEEQKKAAAEKAKSDEAAKTASIQAGSANLELPQTPPILDEVGVLPN